MASGDLENGMRRGTKSCMECRKRKVKCIFGADKKVCMNCISRKDECVMQTKATNLISNTLLHGRSKPKTSMEERVAYLENIVAPQFSSLDSQPLHQNLDRRYGSPITTESITQQTNVVPSLDPIGSLFNNTIWKQQVTEPEKGSLSSESVGSAILSTLSPKSSIKDMRVVHELCEGVPPTNLIESIVEATNSWWNTWAPVGTWFQYLKAQKNFITLLEVINWTLSSDNPALVALGLLLFITCLQQLDNRAHKDIISHLSHAPGELFQIFFDRVIHLVINDNDYSNSYPGIEVMLMTAKIYMNLGILKMTWILTHRAISHAQLLGFHRPHQNSPNESNAHMAIRHEIWLEICERDLYTSLLLDLPYAANWRTISPGVHGLPGTVRHFRYLMMGLCGRLIDRNQMGLGTSIPETQDLAHDMIAAASTLSSELWDAPNALLSGRVDRSEYMELLAATFWYFQAKVLLHQPLMIESLEDHQRVDHKEACLAACRETLRIYNSMRTDSTAVFSMVKLIDYQAFICSAILLLGLLGYGIMTSQPLPPTMNEDQDWVMVQSILQTLRNASTVTNNSIAFQAVQGLETLSLLVECRRTGVCPPSQDSMPFVKMTIPGSGVITLSPGKLMTKSTSTPSVVTAMHLKPTFHLSNPDPLDPIVQSASGSISQKILESDSLLNTDVGGDISMMDLDWTNMIGTNFDDDWAWLVDLNAANPI